MSKMTDKEIILMKIIKELKSTQLLVHGGNSYYKHGEHNRETYKDSSVGSYYAHFSTHAESEVKVGDLVLCDTGFVHEFSIGFVTQIVSKNDMYLREIGSEKICHVTNESFTRLLDFYSDFIDGERRQLQLKIIKAMKKIDDFHHLFGGLSFENDEAIVVVRERYNGFGLTKPYFIRFKWNKKMTIKSLIKILNDAEFGKREFEVDPVAKAKRDEQIAKNKAEALKKKENDVGL